MFDDVIWKNDINIPPEDANFMNALIAGEPTRVRNEKFFLFDIVANKSNGIDVDKWLIICVHPVLLNEMLLSADSIILPGIP